MRSAFMPEVRLDAEQARRAAHGARCRARRRSAAEVVRLTDEHGLIALAEPRGDGLLAPVVGLRG